MEKMNLEFKSEWVRNGIDENAVSFAQKFGKHLCPLYEGKPSKQALTTSQIRNFFGEVKRIQDKGFDKEKASFLLLKPKLAYAEARVLQKSGKSRISDFRKVMDKAHEAVSNDTQFLNFVNFLEATLAYHKFYGGKD